MRVPEAAKDLASDLRALFGTRLLSVVAYAPPIDRPGAPATTLAVIDRLDAADLARCSKQLAGWHERGLATPLFFAGHEFPRAIDAFPLEFGAILADHVLVAGENPFVGVRVDPADVRRACEVQARSHLLHLREGYLETEGRGDAVASLMTRSAEPLAALVQSVARLIGAGSSELGASVHVIEDRLGLVRGTLSDVVALGAGRPIAADRAHQLLTSYLGAIEQLVRYLDRWPDV